MAKAAGISLIPNPLPIGLSSWIIQDGNYDDFEVGQTRAFALEFYAPQSLTRVRAGSKAFRHVVDADFDVRSECVHGAKNWWILDFGLLAYSDRPAPEPLEVGQLFQGRISLGVDPFFYFEEHARQEGTPALIYDWRIDRIEMQTAPFVEQHRMLVRDASKLGWRSIERTKAWDDDGGNAEYLLHCTCLDDRPRRSLKKRGHRS